MKTACVIGAGVSGLAAAYLLQQQGWQVTVVEGSDRLGGNACTMQVVQSWNKDGTPNAVRWVDMGVNDFNANSYTQIKAMLDKLGVPYLPLVDQASFTSPLGSFPPSEVDFGQLPDARQALDYVNYTLGDDGQTPPPQGLLDDWNAFQTYAPLDAQKPACANMTVAQYLQWAQAAGTIKNAELLGKYCLYPRINGMYFTVDDQPQDMPFVGIMQYYVLQEGLGTKQGPARMYWKNGTTSWIDALVQVLTAPAAGWVPVRFLPGTLANVAASAGAAPAVSFHATTSAPVPMPQSFDAVVFACHARDAMTSIKSGITQDQVNVLGAFEYRQSCALAHTYAPALPMSKSLWRTYNIVIHEGYGQLTPYVIDYVINLHQNDPANPQFDKFDTPYILYSINPQVPIPDKYILRQPIKDPTTGAYRKAVAYFPHNVMRLNSMWAQSVLWGARWPYPKDPAFEYHWGSYQPGTPVQGQNGLYFTGGWTLLAGLHEQCWQSATEVVDLIQHGNAHVANYQYIPHHQRGSKKFLPASQRRLLGLK